jgi:hypothetical protein
MADYDLTQTGQEVQDILDGAAMQTDLTAETERAELAEQSLQGGIEAEETRAKAAEKQNADDIDVIESKIPAGASDQNQLADKEFVNNSIATATATYRGAYNLVNDLGLTVGATHEQIATALAGAISTADNNDYCFVQIPTADATPTQIASIERYKFNGTAWAYEYTLNNSGFTAAQWAALNSGITSGLVAKLSALPTNDALTLALAGKQDVLTFDNEPTSGSNNPVKSGGVYDAIDVEATTRAAAIAAIVALIPEAASAFNQLADKSFVNSSISTATAVFKGTYNVVVDLELSYNATQEQIATMLASKIISADNNDYCFVQIPTSDAAPLQIARTDRYKFNGTAWAYEYTLNNSGFTAAQWAAINSGITSLLKDKLIDLPTATELTALLAAKQNQLTFDTTPTTGSTNPVTSGGIKSAIDAEKARAEAAEADRYTKSETYNKTEINGMVSTPHQNYVTVPTYASLPSSGQSTDTIYRVSSYDGANNQVDETVYSEYAWDGTQYVFLRVNSQIEEVFDITVYNNNTKYADLSAALGVDGANIPATLRRGGMSVKFVQSSDNNYVKFFCTADEFTTDVTKWQGVDDKPTHGSDNLVKSGGVAATIEGELETLTPTYANGQYISARGNIGSYSNGRISSPIALNKGDKVFITVTANSNVAIVSKTTPQGGAGTYTPVVIGTGSDSSVYVQDASYTADEDCYIAFSSLAAPSNEKIIRFDPTCINGKISVLKDEVDSINEQINGSETSSPLSFTTTTGYYINYLGGKSALGSGIITSPIQVSKGDIINVSAKINSMVAAISKTDSSGSSYEPVVIGTGDDVSVQSVSYVSGEDGYIALSSVGTNPSGTKRAGGYDKIIEVFDDEINDCEDGITECKQRISALENPAYAPYKINIFAAFDNLVCIGDSLTKSLVYTSASDARVAFVPYPKVLSRICGNLFTTLATGGFSAKDAWDTYGNDIVSKVNAIGIVYLGTNNGITDTLSTDVVGNDPANWADNNVGCYCRIVHKMLSLGYKVLLVKCWVTSGTGDSNLANTNSAIAHIAERFGCAVIDAPVTHAAQYHLFPDLSDENYVHYNDLGYSWFASQLINAVGNMETNQMKLLIPNA